MLDASLSGRKILWALLAGVLQLLLLHVYV